MYKIEWEQLKQNILDKLLGEYPFLKTLSLTNLNMERYVYSHRLMDDNEDSLENTVKSAYRYLFKTIGMKVNIEEYLGKEIKEIEELKRLSFTPVMTFNLRKGIELSVNGPNLLNVNRAELIEYIKIIRERFAVDNGRSIDLIFGDSKYLISELESLVESEYLKLHIDKLLTIINKIYVNSNSNVMRERYSAIVDEEIENYIKLDKNTNTGK